MKEQVKKQLEEKEKLRFKCGACKREWVEERPKDRYIRSGDGTNFYITRGDEKSRHPIHCPKCNDSAQIRRIPPPMRPSTDGYHHAQKSIWATPISNGQGDI